MEERNPLTPEKTEKPKLRETIRQAVANIWQRVGSWLEGFRLAPGWLRGPAWMVGVLVLISGLFYGYYAYTGFGRWIDALVAAVLAVLIYLLVLLVVPPILKILFKLPPLLLVVTAAALVAQVYFWNDYTWVNWVFVTAAALGSVFLGVFIYALVQRDWAGSLLRKKIMLAVMGVLGTAAFVFLIVVFFHPGTPAEVLPVQVSLGTPAIDAEDPTQPGDYQVLTLTYGSGTDRWRPEYGEDVDIQTKTVNVASYVVYKGLEKKARDWFFGFSTTAVPLNGRVWYPDGEGPFPLVLIVHGNHAMTDYSDPGYAYLGELFASRGFITVSVDENFLNGGIYGESSGENDARAWLLLRHIGLFDGWDQEEGSPFYGKVDMGNIALIGHSRGGEAVVHAAVFNQLSRYPSNAGIRWNFNYGIRAVAAIAPVDKQYQPADHPAELVDISYLVLQGAHDSDLDNFVGIQQFERIYFEDEESGSFAAGVYIYRANHGQFNTVWGGRDARGIKGQMLNHRALLSGEEQRQISSLYLTAFLETTLHGQTAYQPIFEDYRTAGNWLPQTNYITQYRDIGAYMLADYEEDFDVTTTTLAGGRAVVNSTIAWSEQQLRYRDNKRQDNHVLRLSWSGVTGAYTLSMPLGTSSAWELDADDVLVFAAADGREPVELEEGLDFHIVLKDQNGRQAAVLASDVLPLQTQFPAEISRLDSWNTYFYKKPSEPVLQSYRIPLSLFIAENPDLRLDALSAVIFRFDEPPAGTLYLDAVGFDVIP